MRSTQHTPLFLAGIWLAATLQSVQAGEPARIETQPVALTVLEGCPATFEVNVSGTPPISVQWLRNDLPLPGATNTSLTLPVVLAADDGARFRVKAINEFGTDLSWEAPLHVTLDPS